MKRRRLKKAAIKKDSRLSVLAIGMGALNELLELRVSSTGKQIVCGDLVADVTHTDKNYLMPAIALKLLEAEFLKDFTMRRGFPEIDTAVVTCKQTSRNYIRIGYMLFLVHQSIERITAQDCLFIGLAGGEHQGAWYSTWEVNHNHHWRAIWRLHAVLEQQDADRTSAAEAKGLPGATVQMTYAEYSALMLLLEAGDAYASQLWRIFACSLHLMQMPIYSPGGSVQRRFYQAVGCNNRFHDRAYRALLRPSVIDKAMRELVRIGKQAHRRSNKALGSQPEHA